MTNALSVADVVGATIASQGVQDAFGVIGSGNLIVTNALCGGGARFHHARHEGGAVCMADGYARVTGRVGIVSVHQGPGLTNTMTGLAEAAKSRTPLLVLAGDSPAAALTSNFRIDQHDLVESVGAIADRVHSPRTAADDAQRAYYRAISERRPVVLMLPIDIQPQPAASVEPQQPPPPPLDAPEPNPRAIAAAAELIANATQPRDHRRPRRRARRCGRGARAARSADRRDPRHLRPGQRSVRRAPLRARNLGRLRQPVRGRAAAAGRPRARPRRLGQPLDDEARRDDQPRRQGDPGRYRGQGDRAATAPPTWR